MQKKQFESLEIKKFQRIEERELIYHIQNSSNEILSVEAENVKEALDKSAVSQASKITIEIPSMKKIFSQNELKTND